MPSKIYAKFRSLRDKLFFGVADVAGEFGIKKESARLACFRYAREGVFIRLKNNMYILEERWRYLEQSDFFVIANYLQVPSYISFATALSFYGVTTQVPQGVFDCACLKRTRSFAPEQGKAVFNYFKLKKPLYYGFVRKGNFFIATPEKAFLDAIYLYSFGKYKLDVTALDIGTLDLVAIKKQASRYPLKTRKMVSKICGI